jgi:hypothetical protein
MSKTIYLAVAPRCRKPKCVPPVSADYHRRNARLFYVAKDMTAAQARAAIAEGSLLPAYKDGKPVPVEGMPAPGTPFMELHDLGRSSEYQHPLLRIGTHVFSRHYNYSLAGGSTYAWHEVNLDGITYNASPLTRGDLERIVRRARQPLTCELVDTREPAMTHKVSTAGILVLVRSGRSFSDIIDNHAELVPHVSDLMGRRFDLLKVVKGEQLTNISF